MSQHLDVMEKFLELQREITELFLTRRSERGAQAHPLQPVGLTETASPRHPLLGEVLRHEPGRELLMRRRMDLSEDLYALDHTLGGRDASVIDPTHHGLPVMPMAFSVEMMAEAANQLVPGKRVIGLKRVRLHRWIPLDEGDPTALEVLARVQSPDSVHVEIRDLGNDSSWKRGPSESLAVDGVVLLGDQYPEPPPVDDFPLTNEGPCRFTPAQLYDEECRLFHGPLFQAVCSTDRQGEEGIEGHLQTLSHTGLFRSTAQPDLITDPLLIDASTHILGCWHLGHADQNGRVVFPYELGTVQLFGPRPATGTRIKCRVLIERSSARQVSHRIDLIAPDNRLWCRLNPAEYWRFYWPLEYTNYFRRKDVLLGQPWPTVQRLLAGRKALCLRIQPPADLTHPIKRGALAHTSLSRSEWRQFSSLRGPETRKTEWLFGRIAAKDALRTLWQEEKGEQILPADMEIEPDVHGRPVARRIAPLAPVLGGEGLGVRGRRDEREEGDLPTISITHAGGMVAAVAAFKDRVGIDLEPIQPRAEGFEEIAFDATERQLLDRFEPERDEGIARFWCAREAVAKALGRGQVAGPRSLAVRKWDAATGMIFLALGPVLAAEFPELRLDLLMAQTVRDGDLVVAVSFAERSNS